MERSTSSFAGHFLDNTRILIKGVITGILILIMLIPQHYIRELVADRQERQKDVTREISSKWASDQLLTGPVLMVPYQVNVRNTNGQIISYTKKAYFLPDELAVSSTLQPESRHRSRYDVTLYRAPIRMSGRFNTLPLTALSIAPENVLWNEARILLGISDVKGLEDQVRLSWNDTVRQLDAGLPLNDVLKQGLNTGVPLTAAGAAFSLDLSLKGSGLLRFVPVGRTTTVQLAGNWKDPEFNGEFLPAQSKVTDESFSASWKVLNVSRNFPQQWKESEQDLQSSAFGVSLLQPNGSYAKTERSVKYALLFIGLTFGIFFFIEILQKKAIHPVQYLLVGLALIVFYSLLLSISEYTGFNPAYLLAAAATVSLIGLYIWSVLGSGRTAISFTAALAGLYAYIFVLIQQQDYALISGSIGLFIILAILMYFSRRVDWYGTGRTPVQPSTDPV